MLAGRVRANPADTEAKARLAELRDAEADARGAMEEAIAFDLEAPTY
jgi:hypothetical protein